MEGKLDLVNFMDSLFDIKGIVVITGAIGLMGKHHTRAVLEHNGSVALIDIDINKLEDFKSILKSEGYKGIHIYSCDITDKKNVEAVLEDLSNKHLPIVGLINNAAINPAVGDSLQNNGSLENYDFLIWNEEI